MAKINITSHSATPKTAEKRRNLQFGNQSAQELLEIDSGITTLVRHLIADDDNRDSDNEMFGVFRVLQLQNDIQWEILCRIPTEQLEKIPNNDNEGGELS